MALPPHEPTPPSRAALAALLAAMVFAAIAPIAAWLAWQVAGQAGAQQDRTREELLRSAGSFAQSVNRELGSSIDALTVLSQSEIFQQNRVAAWGRLLHGRPRRDWDSVFVLDAQGDVVLDTAPRPAPPEALRPLHAEAIRRLGPVVSGAGGISIAMPIVQGNRVVYVLGVRLSDSVWPRLAANASPPDGRAQLYDAQGRLISESKPGGTAPADVQAMVKTRSGTQRAHDGAGRAVIAAWDLVPLSGWRARVDVPAEPVDASQRRLVLDALSTSGLALVAGLAIAAIVGALLLRRLRPH